MKEHPAFAAFLEWAIAIYIGVGVGFATHNIMLGASAYFIYLKLDKIQDKI